MLAPLPLPNGDVPESIQRFVNPDAPGPARMMAARGMVPVKGADVVFMLCQLNAGEDQAVADAAGKSLAEMPENVLLPACAGLAHPSILHHVAERFATQERVCEAIVLNQAAHGQTVATIAKKASERLTELIALNEERVLAYPQIIEELYKNTNTRMSTADRLIELAARHKLELPGIPNFKEHAAALQGVLIPEPTEEPLPSDQIFSEAIELDADDPEVFDDKTTSTDKDDNKEEVNDKFKPLSFRIAKMTAPEKMRLAIIGDASARALLVKDNNKQVAMSAVKSPKMRDKEAAVIANSREIGEDILRYIANKKDWARSYEVKRSLLFNPKTPVGIALKFLGHMRENDLKTLAKSKNVPGPLSPQRCNASTRSKRNSASFSRAHGPTLLSVGGIYLKPRRGPRPRPERIATMTSVKRLTVPEFMHGQQKRTMITAYDATFARILDSAGVDALLVGDSLGMVVQGRDDTLAVTLDDVIYHTRAVVRGSTRALVISDMPFMTYASPEDALRNAGRLLQEGGAQAVKLEGGTTVANSVKGIVTAGIPVMGHVGLTPQHVHAMGGFRVQGKGGAAQSVLDDVRALVDAGVFSIVLEGIPRELALTIQQNCPVPTIGIGAGPDCDGQVLVCYDLLGLCGDFQPKFVRRFAELHEVAVHAAASFVEAVRAGTFPEDKHSFHDSTRTKTKPENNKSVPSRTTETLSESSVTAECRYGSR